MAVSPGGVANIEIGGCLAGRRCILIGRDLLGLGVARGSRIRRTYAPRVVVFDTNVSATALTGYHRIARATADSVSVRSLETVRTSDIVLKVIG